MKSYLLFICVTKLGVTYLPYNLHTLLAHSLWKFDTAKLLNKLISKLAVSNDVSFSNENFYKSTPECYRWKFLTKNIPEIAKLEDFRLNYRTFMFSHTKPAYLMYPSHVMDTYNHW